MPVEFPRNERAERVIARLEAQGYDACAVGGCVRDALLGRRPHDWDIGTSARPEETLRCFADCMVLETGIRHGTVTVVLEGEPIEVTTYRTETGYADGRHPDRVAFVRRLEDDLARRDFTINAMAWHPARGLTDRFGGREDLAAGRIRCVGDPARRFREDALRILRGLRFAAVCGFTVEPQTARAMREEQGGLRSVAAERVNAELSRLLTGSDAARVLREFADLLAGVLPEIAPMRGFAQNNPHHCWDVWEHTLHALQVSAPDSAVRWTLLFHDSGKPPTYREDEKGIGHFPGHPAVSERLADQAMRRLKFDTGTRERIDRLVKLHDIPAENDPRFVRRWLNRLGEGDFRRLLEVKRADTLAQAPAYRPPRLAMLDGLEATLESVLQQQDCFRLKDLAVNGRDLLAAGLPEGPAVGRTLRFLLDGVIDGRLPNKKEALLAALRESGPGRRGAE
ncbi:MAG TPA: HD domain-containing protein [Firmicutes bacterium]|nr:HD domain-containing protein [Bacillota bacterium]